MGAIISFVTGGIGRWIVLAVGIAIALAVVRHHLIQEGRDEVLNEIAKQEVRVRNLRDGITQSMEKKHAQNVADITARFDKFIAGLRESGSRPKPIPVTANVCDDAAGNDRLSAAIDGYLERDRQIAAGERAAIAERVGKPAELQTRALIDTQAWLTEQQGVK